MSFLNDVCYIEPCTDGCRFCTFLGVDDVNVKSVDMSTDTWISIQHTFRNYHTAFTFDVIEHTIRIANLSNETLASLGCYNILRRCPIYKYSCEAEFVLVGNSIQSTDYYQLTLPTTELANEMYTKMDYFFSVTNWQTKVLSDPDWNKKYIWQEMYWSDGGPEYEYWYYDNDEDLADHVIIHERNLSLGMYDVTTTFHTSVQGQEKHTLYTKIVKAGYGKELQESFQHLKVLNEIQTSMIMKYQVPNDIFGILREYLTFHFIE